MSVAIWCPGDGQGHVTRAVAAAHTLGMDPADVTLLVGDPTTVDPRVSGAHPLGVARLPLDGVEELWVDALPCGRGELDVAALAGVGRVNHLARRLDWARFVALLPSDPPWFRRTVVTEALPDAQRAWLVERSSTVVDLELRDPPVPSLPADIVAAVRGAWVVVHAGPRSEVEELQATARQAARVDGVDEETVDGDTIVLGTGGLDVVPAWPLLSHAARLFTGGGANTVRQVRIHAPHVPHVAVPFPRRHDDQVGRVRWHRAHPPARPDAERWTPLP